MSQAMAVDTSALVGGHGFPSWASALREFIESRGITAYVVGGGVRDSLLGRKVEDMDAAAETSVPGILELGRELARYFGGSYVPLAPRRGIVRVVLPEGGFVDLSAAPNGIMDDLARRDFTVNAMAAPLADAETGIRRARVIDPHNGLADIDGGIIRCVSSSCFDDDPIRLLRAPRLAVQLGFAMSAETRRSITHKAGLLARPSRERVRDEMLKLMSAPNAVSAVRTIDEVGLLTVVIPELDGARGVTQPEEHYWDVFDHCVETVGQIERILDRGRSADDWAVRLIPEPPDANSHFAERISDGHTRSTLLKLGGLLHDIAKPSTKTMEENGRVRFFGHHKAGADVVDGILTRMRFGTRGRKFVVGLVRHHLRPRQMAEPGAKPTMRAVSRFFRNLGDAAVSVLYLNMADYLAARGPLLDRAEWREHCELIAHILGGTSECVHAPRLVTGADIMDGFSVSPGPLVGELLRAVDDSRSAGEIATKIEAMRLVGRMLETKQYSERRISKTLDGEQVA